MVSSNSYCVVAVYSPTATGESFNPSCHAIALNVLPNTVGAGPLGPDIELPLPVGPPVGVVPSSVQRKEAPADVVAIVTVMGLPA